MHLIAEDIGMPFVFVEMRHAIVHGALPTLPRLSRIAREALKWIHDYYWDLDDEQAGNAVQSAKPSIAEVSATEFRGILKQFSKSRKAEIKAKSGGEAVSVASGPAARDIINLCRGYQPKLETLCAVLLEEKFLVPALRNGKRHMAGAVLLWQDLLQRITIYQRLFLETLLRALVEHADLNIGGEDETLSEAALFWARHICMDEAWRKKHRGEEYLRAGVELRSFAMNELLMGGSLEGEEVAKEIMKTASDVFEDTWEVIMKGMDE
jgi:hypothetical protein